MKLWVDDKRPAPDDSWTPAETSEEAIEMLVLSQLPMWDDPLIEVSLDHDLGGDDTGFKVLDWMIEHKVWPKTLTIHTSNPPARKRMLQAANHEAPDWVDIFVITDHTASHG